MSADESPSSESFSLLRLRVTAEADAGALARVLERFQNMNILPRRVVAEISTQDLLHVQVDVFGITEERATLITAKVGQVTSVIDAFWHHV